jgi:hypothetical protein
MNPVVRLHLGLREYLLQLSVRITSRDSLLRKEYWAKVEKVWCY